MQLGMSAKCHEPDIARLVEKEGAAAPSGECLSFA
jgi:hypothetical protein